MDVGPEYKAANKGEAMPESKVMLPPILRLPWPKEGSLHPYALERYLKFLEELYHEVPLDQLTDEDLTEDEQTKRNESADGIREWLIKCSKDAGEGALMVYPYSSVVNYDMRKLNSLLKAAYERKIERAGQKAEKQRQVAALVEIDPPFDDAKKYLNEKEYERFRQSLRGAAVAYLDGGKGCPLNDWRFDHRAGDYLGWTGIIERRKGEEARQKRAELEHSQFLKEINDTIKEFKQELAKEKKPSFAYPSSFWAGYRPWSWCELKLPTKDAITKWAEENYIFKKIPPELREFVVWDIEWQAQALPYARYELLGVSCLTWCFGVRVLVEAHLGIVERRFVREFHGEKRQMKIEGEELGTIFIGPADYEVVEGFTTPVALLATLAKGELEEEGIAVVQQGGSSITFRVRGYGEELVTVKKDFRQFVIDVSKDEGLAQGLLFAWVIDELTGHLLKEKAKLPLPHLLGAETSSGQTSDNNSDVIAALEALGYKKGEIKEMVDTTELSPSMSLEEKIQVVFKNMET